MTQPNVATRTLTIEREFAHPPTKVWRALTESQLLGEWLMKNDFEPRIGHRFNFRADPVPGWNGITDCEVLAVEPEKRLSYSWNSSGDQAGGLTTVVTYTLQPTPKGTLLRLEQSGFRPENERNYQGASYGWRKFLDSLARVLER